MGENRQGAKAARVFGRDSLASIPNLLATLASWRFFSASLHDVMNDEKRGAGGVKQQQQPLRGFFSNLFG